jgi:hypothetical protein
MNVYSLNSDDEDNPPFRPMQRRTGTPVVLTQHREPKKIGLDSDSSHHASSAGAGAGASDGNSDPTCVASASTQLTSPASSSSNPGRRSSTKRCETPMDKLSNTFLQTNEMLVHGLQLNHQDKFEDKQRHRDTKYQERENQRAFDKWLSEHKAEQADKERDAQLKLSADRIKQLKLEVRLQQMKH